MSKIQPFVNVKILQRNVWLAGAAGTGHTFLCKIMTFLKGCILITIGSICTKLKDFVYLGVLSIVANPIIYRLVPSPSRYEIRQ